IMENQARGAGGEIQLTDGMVRLAQKQPFLGFEFAGRSFDCGSKIGFLAANVSYALARKDLAADLRAELKRLREGPPGGAPTPGPPRPPPPPPPPPRAGPRTANRRPPT